MKQILLATCFLVGIFSTSNAQIITTSDCSTSTIILPSGNYLMSFEGNAGADETELNGVTCVSGAVPSVNVESNSRWVRWTCPTDDTITFVISPLKPADDIDFALFKLDDGILNCDNKTPIRCQAAGDFSIPSPCMGKTGLKLDEIDLEESAGCDSTKNNFLAPLVVKAGESFALAILDFTSPFASCTLDFGSSTGVSGNLDSEILSKTRLLPNPAAGDFEVFFVKKGEGEVDFSMFDLFGKLVFQQKKWIAAGRQTEHFSALNLPAGAYFLKISEVGKSTVLRFTKI